jgi:hypothetical protein
MICLVYQYRTGPAFNPQSRFQSPAPAPMLNQASAGAVSLPRPLESGADGETLLTVQVPDPDRGVVVGEGEPGAVG